MTVKIYLCEARDTTVAEIDDAIRTLVNLRNSVIDSSPSTHWSSEMGEAREALDIAAQAIDVMIKSPTKPERFNPEDIDRLRVVSD